MIRILVLLLVVLIFGSFTFYYLERGGEEVKGIWDAVYWVLVTITTVGYGDYTPKTTGGRITFVFVALGGIGTIAYVLERLISLSTRGQLMSLLGSGAVKMKDHCIIVGWNAQAVEAVRELRHENERFLVAGSNVSHTELNALEIPYISGDSTKKETLERCNIAEAKTMMVLLGDDSETIMTALATRRQNPQINLVATCEAREHLEMMRKAGINHVISYAEISGRLLAHAVTEPIVVEFITQATTAVQGFDVAQLEIEKSTKLPEVPLKANAKVVAIYKDGRFDFKFPRDIVLEKGDFLIVVYS